MFQTKKDVDKHVSDVLGKIINEDERNLRGYVFAKMYYQVKDYETAKRYLAGFLSLRKNSASGHKLMGKIHENTGHLERAIQSYKDSLEIESNQKDVVFKICELYCKIPVDPDRARYWADRAEKLDPRNEIVFRLRESLVNADGEQNMRELEDLITNELLVKPRDCSLRIKLLRLYLDTERIQDAFDHAIQVEKRNPFPQSLEWCYCLVDVFETYLEEHGQQYTCFLSRYLLTVLDRLVYLSLEEGIEHDVEHSRVSSTQSRSIASMTAIQSFDQHLFKSWQLKENAAEWWSSFINHMEGQLYFHMATVILKRIKQDHGNLKELSRMGAALLLAAYSYKPPDLDSPWCANSSSEDKSAFKAVHDQACFRLSQSGHVLIGMCREDQSKWLGKVRDQVSTTQSVEKIYQRALNNRGQRLSEPNSFFLSNSLIDSLSQEFPDHKTLQEYDNVAHMLRSESLHHLVWLALQQYNIKDKVQPTYNFRVFEGLPFSVLKLENATPESLCVLDVEAFLYATVRCSALALDEVQSFAYISPDMPAFLPASISVRLCTSDQSSWWKAAYTLYSKIGTNNLGDLRRKLQRGIEVIRCIGLHGIDVNLVVHLAETFADRASELKAQSDNDEAYSREVSHLESRATLYWKAAIVMLERLTKNLQIRFPNDRLFPSHGHDPSNEEALALLEAGRFYLACQAMNDGNHETAITAFESLHSPFASFYQSLSFKKLASEEFDNKSRESITSEMRSRHVILLTRARDALYVTLDRIRSDKKHPLNQILSQEIEDVETRLARIDPETAQRHEFDAATEESLSTQYSEEHIPSSPLQSGPVNVISSKKMGSSANVSSRVALPHTPLNLVKHAMTPHKIGGRARPSPERLDAQIRSLFSRQDMLFNTVVEQNKALLETNAAIAEQLKQNQVVFEKLAVVLEEALKVQPVSKGRQKSGRRSHAIRNQFSRPPQSTDDGNEDDDDDYDDDGCFYDEDGAECENDKRQEADVDFKYNPAYMAQDHMMPNDFSYGQSAGLHASSAVNYVTPPSGEQISAQANYNSYYAATVASASQNIPTGHLPQVSPVNLMQPIQHPLSTVPPSFFSPSAATIFAGLPFSEGQKLPEFHFNVESTLAVTNAQVKPSVFSRLGPQPSVDVLGSQVSPLFNKSIMGVESAVSSENYAGLSTITPPVVSNPVLSSSVSIMNGSASVVDGIEPHAFQIALPPQASVHVLPTVSLSSNIGLDVTSPANILSDVVASNVMSSGTTHFIGRIRKVSANESSDYIEEDSFNADFKPVIPLPAEVEVKTGEEDELVLFKDRAKLFRYIDKEWKERGVGNLKILHNQATSKVRILMRRDQILKTCANHYIVPSMELSPMKNVENAWLWAAQDYADGDIKIEQFCVRFKTVESAKKFKEVFDMAKELSSKNESKSPSVTNADNLVGFGQQFLPKEGSWECAVCLIRNSADRGTCVACESHNPKGHEVKDDSSLKSGGISSGLQNVSTAEYKFGIPPQAPRVSDLNTASPFSSFGFSFSPVSSPVFKFNFTQSISNTDTTSTPVTAISGGFQQPKELVFGSACASSQAKPSGFVFGASSVHSGATPPMGPASSLLSALASKQELNKDVCEKDSSLENSGEGDAKTKSILTPPKFTLGGFSFMSIPVVKKDEEEITTVSQPVKPEASKPNPFANFSFNFAPATSPVKSDSGEMKKQDDAEITESNAVQAISGISFEGGARQEEFEPSVDFKPVIPLPELVDVKTGEEDEEKLFGERAKLFRYVAETKEWKERGVGEIKLLQHQTTKRVRILMRREQVLKICANHYITKQMQLRPMPSSDKAWVWVANDFSDGKLSQENFAVRFKNAEKANAFKEAFEEAQRAIESETVSPGATPDSLLEHFKPKPGSWECPTCCIRNDASVEVCIACQTNMFSTTPVQSEAPHLPKVSTANEPEVQQKPTKEELVPLSELFKPQQGSWECPACYLRNAVESIVCQACQTLKPEASPVEKTSQPSSAVSIGAFKFGFGSSVTTTSTTTTNNMFESSQRKTKGRDEGGGILRNMLADCAASDVAQTPDFPSKFEFGAPKNAASGVEFQFGTPQKYSFTFGGINPKSPTKIKSPVEDSVEGEQDDDTGAESEGDGIYFHPVIPLPDKVEVRTGEEDEHVLYCQRAKLYRFADGEWKERGVGEFKILQHSKTGKMRLLMRREQILKVCCNHHLVPQLSFQSKDERSVMWSANDFADGEVKHERLVLRFKNAELAQEFLEIVTETQEKLSQTNVSAGAEGSSVESPVLSFSFKSEDKNKMSPSSLFTFGERFSNLGAVSPLGSIFGNLSPQTSMTEENVTKEDVVSLKEVEEDEATDDIVVIFERKCTADELLMATELQLPKNFYSYKEKPPCPGCRGCEVETDDVKISWEANASDEQVQKALALKLSPAFYLYETKPPCPGCRGCVDDTPKHDDEVKEAEVAPPVESTPTVVQTEEQSSSAPEESSVSEKPEVVSMDIFAKSAVATVSFSNLAEQGTNVFAKTDQSKEFHFSGSGAPVFQSAKGQSRNSDEEDDNDEGDQENDEHEPHFEPVVPLPELVDVKTGEEDEDRVFCRRAKLFRYNEPTKEWKERGVGDMKILKSRQTGRFRLLMRREQIHKIACNHTLTVDMKLSPMMSSDNAFCWGALDFAEETPVTEKFAVRFKNEEIAKEFKMAFEKCQQDLLKSH